MNGLTHRHDWTGAARPCGKTHRGLDSRKWACEHWVCRKCDALDPRNYNVIKKGA